jgi:RNA polymerase sigma factor (sigma-70 family)
MGLHSDREIAIELRRGNTAAWQHVYDENAKRLWWVIARQINGPAKRVHADICDVFQETMLAAASSANSYDAQKGSIWSWLCGVARNQIALFYRGKSKLGEPTDSAVDAVMEWLESSDGGPVEELLTAEVVDLVRDILRQLPVEYAALLSATYIDGLNSQVLAARNSTTPNAIRSKLVRARALFRKTFEANYVLDSRP